MTATASPRVPYTRLSADAYKALLAAGKAIHGSAIEQELQELVFMWGSQINGRGYCMDLQGASLRKRESSRARSTRCRPGMKAVSSTHANEARWAGPRRSPAARWRAVAGGVRCTVAALRGGGHQQPEHRRRRDQRLKPPWCPAAVSNLPDPAIPPPARVDGRNQWQTAQ